MRSSDDGNNADADPESSSAHDSSPVVLHRFSFADDILRAINDSNLVAKIDGDKFYSGKISANCYNGDVMVKRQLFDFSFDKKKEFRKEIEILSDCDHVNIISLVGYCDEQGIYEGFLVYDFKPNGTLYDYLYKHDQNRLNVEQRLEICIGVAKGLSYLHSRNLFDIVSGCLKPGYIFLDDNLVPKMTRFNLIQDKRPYINQVVDELQLALKLQKHQYGDDASQQFSDLDNSTSILSCRIFSFSDIKRVTDEFSEKNFLGKGAFGSVYRGSIFGNGYTGLVAVKRMSIDPEQGIPSFRKEIALLSNCNHVNIIRLLGYCDEGDEKILLYEFMPNGSLYDYLYHRKECTPLTVEQRLEICLGVANGLSYLHSRKDYHIIHSDLKTDNILLDANLVPKIADFGLSRTRDVGPSSSEIITYNIQGTEGYIAPECYEPNYMLSRKADVYAFGVVLLELLCERPAWKRLVTYALPYVLRGELRKFTPKYVEDNISLRCSRTCEYLIRDCLDTDPNKRPSMYQVVDRFELALKMQNQGQDI